MSDDKLLKLAKEMADDCIAVRVRLLSRVVTGIYDRRVLRLGVKANQGAMLVMIARRGATTQRQIGERLQMEKSTVSRNVERLKAKGWVAIKGDGNAHQQEIELTKDGRTLLFEIHGEWLKAQKEALELLGQESVKNIKRITGKNLGF